MARGGINKFHVKQARDGLIAKGQHPSLDAIRSALGDTGSKSTIHRYMKELEQEEGTRLDDHALLSNTLKEMVERLAAQLHSEARDIVAHQDDSHQQQLRTLRDRLASMEASHTKCTAESNQCQADLAHERSQHQLTTAAFHTEQLRAHRLEQEVAGLKNQLATAEKHQASLEEKHQHAREALEHYRLSIKEQRDQDQRRHEQQLQQLQAEIRQFQQSLIVKQNEITETSKDNARLAAELIASRKQLAHSERETKEYQHALTVEKEKSATQEYRLLDAASKIAALTAELHAVHEKSETEVSKSIALQNECQKMEAKLEAQVMLIDALKGQLSEGAFSSEKSYATEKDKIDMLKQRAARASEAIEHGRTVDGDKFLDSLDTGKQG